MTRLVIGLTGAAGAGKDTAAAALEDIFRAFGEDALILSFAEPLRDMLKPLLRAAGISPHVLSGRTR